MSGKAVVSVVYGRGISGEREIEVGSEREKGDFRYRSKKTERVRGLRRAGSALNLDPTSVIPDPGAPRLWKPLRRSNPLAKAGG